MRRVPGNKIAIMETIATYDKQLDKIYGKLERLKDPVKIRATRKLAEEYNIKKAMLVQSNYEYGRDSFTDNDNNIEKSKKVVKIRFSEYMKTYFPESSYEEYNDEYNKLSQQVYNDIEAQRKNLSAYKDDVDWANRKRRTPRDSR